MNEPILITGLGIVSAIGLDAGQTLEALRGGRTGIGPLRYLLTSHHEFPVGEVDMSTDAMREHLGIPSSQPATRTAMMGIMAVRQALDQARLDASELPRTAFVSGTTVGGMDMSEQFYPDFLTNDTRNDYISQHDCGACTESIADYFGRFASVSTLSTACSSAANAIINGANLLRSGKAEIAVVGGSECITKFHLNGFNSLMILDTERCRPFDATRAGLNLGEGAAFLVIETASSARRRGATPIAVLRGYGNACDAFHQTASSPDGEGSFLAMQQALADAGLQPSDIDYVNAHGTGTPNNDSSESQAMMRLFGSEMPPVSSTKSFTGHTTSASGSIEAVICILALQHQFLPLNLGWQHQMEDGITPVTDQHPQRPLRNVLCNSFGFGGNDSSLVIGDLSPDDLNDPNSLNSLNSLTPDPSPKERGVYTCEGEGSSNDTREGEGGSNYTCEGEGGSNYTREGEGSNDGANKGNHSPLLGRGVGGEAGEVFITSATQVSIQAGLSEAWLDAPIAYSEPYVRSLDVDFKQWLSPGESRRMGKLLKRAIATSLTAMQQSGVEHPDAIITGTGLGCIESTEILLTHLCDEGEENCKPTPFMQSTHNTISSLVSIHTHTHSYNATYAHKDASFDCALEDALTQIQLGRIRTALVGGHDEMTPKYFGLLCKTGRLGNPGQVASETAVSVMLDSRPSENALCRLTGFARIYQPTAYELRDLALSMGHVDAVMTSANGCEATDAATLAEIGELLPGVPQLRYKHLFGDSYTASGIAIYATAHILKAQRLPDAMLVDASQRPAALNRILVINDDEGKNYTFALLETVK